MRDSSRSSRSLEPVECSEPPCRPLASKMPGDFFRAFVTFGARVYLMGTDHSSGWNFWVIRSASGSTVEGYGRAEERRYQE